jgi:hypothetical protein
MNINFTHKKSSEILSKILVGLILIAVVTGCQSKTKEETEQAKDSLAIANPTQSELNSDQSALLKNVLGNSAEGIIRGISFGDDIAKVKATETFEMFEETADHLGYTSETPQLETIDVQYFINAEKKVSKIQVDVYLNSGDATKQLWNASKNHFTEIYASPKQENKSFVWNKNSVKVQMEDVTKGKDFGLKFVFYPTNKNVLAAK